MSAMRVQRGHPKREKVAKMVKEPRGGKSVLRLAVALAGFSQLGAGSSFVHFSGKVMVVNSLNNGSFM